MPFTKPKCWTLRDMSTLWINLFYTDSVYTVSQRWMNDKYAKFEFKIQLLHKCHRFNGDSVYTVSVYKIYSYIIS